MKTNQAKAALAAYIKLAKARDAAGDCVMRDHHLRDAKELPLPSEYIKKAISHNNL